MIINTTRRWWLLLSLLLSQPLQAALAPFVITDIQVEGLQRIAIGTVFNYLSLQKGDRVDQSTASRAVRALYQTGFFQDVVLEQDGSTLVVFVQERPSIASIELEGNEAMTREQLLDNLKQLGLSEGRVFNRSLLDKVVQELLRQYMGLGKYSASIKTEVTVLERNRVGVVLRFDEGDEATIHRLNLLGNQFYSDYELTIPFELGERPLFTGLSSQDQYSQQKLSADLESMRSRYLDHGFIDYQIDSAQVGITPNREDVYITVNMSEGDQYTVAGIAVEGETIVPKEQLLTLIPLKQGDLFSRSKVTQGSEQISERLGDMGYAFANVNPIPELDKENKTVTLSYFVDPGSRVYVRRINLSGHQRTRDEVLRREMRQFEGGWISTARVKRSRTRLNRLGFFDEVAVQTPTVPGSPDQVDIDYSVVERDAFGQLSAGIGYSSADGMLVNASVTQENFLGTGKRFSLSINNSSVNTTYSFSFTDPYSTLDGVSRSWSLSYRETDSAEANTADYTSNTYSAGVTFGVPITEYNTVRYGLLYEHTLLAGADSASDEIKTFCTDHATLNDCSFDAYKATTSISHDTRNRALFPSEGGVSRATAEVALPITSSSLSFYKLKLSHQRYLPINESLTFTLNGEIAYAEPFGDTPELPPFERYYAGGIKSVRGYRSNTLGAEGTFDNNNDPLGGDTRVLAGMELLFPPPFNEDASSMRFGTFIDAGNVFDSNTGIDIGELRASFGVSMLWITPIGPLQFSYARPLNEKGSDQTELFQFTIGTQ